MANLIRVIGLPRWKMSFLPVCLMFAIFLHGANFEPIRNDAIRDPSLEARKRDVARETDLDNIRNLKPAALSPVKQPDGVRKANPGVLPSVNRDSSLNDAYNRGGKFFGAPDNAAHIPNMRGGAAAAAAAVPPAPNAPGGGVPRQGGGGYRGNAPNPSVKRPVPIKIAEHPACQQDVKSLCSSSSHTNNFAVLDCLQSDPKSENDISKMCQNFLWQYKRNLTTDLRFDSAAAEVCKDALKELPDCGRLEQGTGHRISCLIEHKTNVTNANCRQFLTKMASIVFSDYMLVYRFANACQKEIVDLKCGRVGAENGNLPHSQGHTIECLSENFNQLGGDCQHEILRIAELQADDYHMDRALFYACRDDRERFCSRTKSGGGRVYKCLFRHKFERDMSHACRDKLAVRQTLAQQNFKVNKAFSEACRYDIRHYQCMKGDVPGGFRQAKLAHILLCLEGVQRDGNIVMPECVGELKEIRRSLMQDYKISPNVVTSCHEEIQQYCDGGLHREGKTLHCLMDLARPRRKDKGYKMETPISSQCMRSLEDLLRQADAGEDYRMDPVLQEACQPVVNAACSDTKPGNAEVIICLMEKLGTRDMNDDCEERLMEIQYFIARDFNLSPRLYRKCSQDARTLCGHSDWDGQFPREKDDARPDSFVFSCLYRYHKEEKLSRGCSFEVRRVMRQRAISVDLEPRIEEPCLANLGAFCSQNVEKGGEMECLTDNYKKLDQKCKWAVGNYTEDIDKDLSLDRVLMKACTPMINRFCHDKVQRDEVDAGDIMQCLIQHKYSPEMNKKCAVGIEHHQLITLTDYRFSFKFKEACKADVLALCKGVRKKSEVVRCLSEIHRNDTLLDQSVRLSRSCRKQLRFELLQRSESVLLDPILEEACREDQKSFCDNVIPGHSHVIDCLKKHRTKLSAACSAKLFKRERLEAVDNSVDFVFMSTCKQMIKRFCKDIDGAKLETCLKGQIHEVDFDEKCKAVLKSRQVAHSKDYRLQPALATACKLDMHKFCKAELQSTAPGKLLEGKVISCLKIKFTAKRLSKNCEDHMRGVIQEAALNYRKDPALSAHCREEIRGLCLKSQGETSDDDDEGGVEECLKQQFLQKKIRNEKCKNEILRLMKETQADVFVDPLLHRACAMDLKHFCFDVQPGQGRLMSCLLHGLADKTVQLSKECEPKLRERVEMWEYAAQVAPAETFVELAQQIQASKARNYLVMVILAVLGVIFFGGLFCGRVTKRVRAELKNK